MSIPINPKLAMMCAELENAWSEILDRYISNLEYYAPFDLELSTIDGVTARFMEEGIEFYPTKNEKENN